MSGERKETVTRAGAARQREGLVELLLEMLSCWLLAVGTALLLNVQFPYPSEFAAVLWQTLVSLLIVLLLTRRWWILLTAGLLAALGTVLWLAVSGVGVANGLGQAVAFFAWWFDDLPQNSPLFTPEIMKIVHALVHVGVTVLLFVFVRVTRRAWPSALLCVAVFVTVMAVGRPASYVLALAAYLVGIFPLIARDRYVGRRLFSRKDKYSLLGRRWGVAAVAVILCAATAGGLLLALPQDTQNIRTRLCSQITADVQSATGWYTAVQRAIDDVTLEKLGLQPNRFRIGGDRELRAAETLAVTSAQAPSLLRVTSFDTFTGTNWNNDFGRSYRIHGLWGKKRTQTLASRAYAGTVWREDLLAMAQPVSYQITMQQESYFLPIPAQLTDVHENTVTKNPVLFNSHGELLSFFELPAGYTYTVDTLDFTEALLKEECYSKLLAVSVAAGDDPLYDDPQSFDRLVELPEDYSQAAYALADSITEQYETTVEQAMALCLYFNRENGFYYTDEPGLLSPKENVVDWLLNNKRGYSVYYATAMATMARSVGIPSRLAAGYKTVWDPVDQVYVVNTAGAYAWVECYFRNLGWVSFDPTPEANEKLLRLPVEPDETEKSEEPEETDGEEEEPIELTLVIPLYVLVSGLLAVVLLVLAIRGLAAGGFYRLSHVRRRYRSPARQMEYYYGDILRQMALLGQPLGVGQTVPEQVAGLRGKLSDGFLRKLWGVLSPVMELHYGGGEPTPEQVAALAAVHRSLEDMIWYRTPRPLYYLRRRVLLPRHFAGVRRYKRRSKGKI